MSGNFEYFPTITIILYKIDFKKALIRIQITSYFSIFLNDSNFFQINIIILHKFNFKFEIKKILIF